jgi:ribosomal protein S18 acetylase RimI-like enzyme
MAIAHAAEPYLPEYEQSWLRCRVLAFLDTTYYDDVVPRKPDRHEGVQLVVRHGNHVVGLLDASLADSESTIECVAVHPDHRRRGVASRLLAAALKQLAQRGARSVEAWTREDPAALSWYRRSGFRETTRYLHVYADAYAGDLGEDLVDSIRSASGLRPVHVFAHAPIDREAELRNRFDRVYVCRRYELDLTPVITPRHVSDSGT